MESIVDENMLDRYTLLGLDSSVSSKTGVTSGGTALLIVDPQVDFHEGGSLGIPGATADSERIAKFITDNSDSIDELVVTLDSHHVSLCDELQFTCYGHVRRGYQHLIHLVLLH